MCGLEDFFGRRGLTRFCELPHSSRNDRLNGAPAKLPKAFSGQLDFHSRVCSSTPPLAIRSGWRRKLSPPTHFPALARKKQVLRYAQDDIVRSGTNGGEWVLRRGIGSSKIKLSSHELFRALSVQEKQGARRLPASQQTAIELTEAAL